MAVSDSNDLVLSSIHIGASADAYIGETTITSEFYYILSKESEESLHQVHVDEDGDFDIPRSKSVSTTRAIFIDHTMATPLESVGTQLWSASLLLADYILHYRTQFMDTTVLELGSGCGLLGIVASNWVNHFYCTDIGENVLELCHRNIIRNCPQIISDKDAINVSVRELDWRNPVIQLDNCSSNQLTAGDSSRQSKFAWDFNDVQKLKKTSLVLAADVIYEDKLTDALFDVLAYLSTVIFETTLTVLIAMEKRINFTLDDLAPSSPAYDHFQMHLRQSYHNSPYGTVRVVFQQIPTSFSQSFQYERVKELELWQLQLYCIETMS